MQKGTCTGEGVARLSVVLLGGLVHGHSLQWRPVRGCTSAAAMLCLTLLDLRRLWFLRGMKEQLLSWLFVFS